MLLRSLKYLFFTASLTSALSASLVVGVAAVQDRGAQIDEALSHTYINSELHKIKSVKVRASSNKLLEYLERCQVGLVKCNNENLGIRELDLILFAEFRKQGRRILFSTRLVSQRSWDILYSISIAGDDYENLLANTMAEVSDFLRKITREFTSLEKAASKRKFRVAIFSVKNGNSAAEKAQISHLVEPLLVSAFAKNDKFQLVERARLKDLSAEKEMVQLGIVRSAKKKIIARGITHYLIGQLKVYDAVRVLSYQLINVKTGLPVFSDLVEWSNDNNILSVAGAIARQTEDTVLNTNGKLVIKSCSVEGVRILFEESHDRSYLRELGYCPLKIEDIPKGSYTLVFKHADRETLLKTVTIHAQQTTLISKIDLPQLDMTFFNKANDFEYKGKYKKAILNYQKFYKKYPRHRLASYAMYREGFIVQIYLKDFSRGRRLLQEVIKRKPDEEIRTEAYFGIALGYKKSGDSVKSKNLFQMITNEYSNTTAAIASRACLEQGC